MAKLTNTTPRIFNMPRRQMGESGPAFGDALIIAPNTTIEVPDWYLTELKKERNWIGRINDRGEITQTRRLGSIAPEDREQAKREPIARTSSLDLEMQAPRAAMHAEVDPKKRHREG